MAYIDWWNRTGPITMGERFGLNEISTRAKTLSPTKSYKDGGRIGFADGNGGTHPLTPELEALTWKSLRQQLSPEEVKRMDYLIDATGSLDDYKAKGGRIGVKKK